MDKKLQTICKTATGHEKTALKSMALVSDLYKSSRQVLVRRHSKIPRNAHLEQKHR